MHKFWNLVKRHCLVFLRDKTAVFFSFLAMIIIIETIIAAAMYDNETMLRLIGAE